ncbi:MAG TPA: ABC transporter substrate-binding protein [Trebonia sp.]
MGTSTRPKRVAGVLGGVTVAVILAACSSSTSSSGSAASGNSTASSPAAASSASVSPPSLASVEASSNTILAAVTPDAAAEAMLPASVKSTSDLNIGTQISAPETFYESDGSTLTGDEYLLASALAKSLGLTPKFNVVQFDELIPGLTAGRFDLTIGAMNDTALREKTISFIDYYNAGIGMVVKAGNPANITGPSSLCGHSVTVQLGTTQQAFAEAQSKTCASSGKGAVTIVYGQENSQQLAEVTAGRVDVFLGDSPTAAYVAEQNPADFQQADANTPIESAPYGIGFEKSQSKLMGAVQAALSNLISNGTYGKIMQAWSLQSGEVTAAKINGMAS